MTRWLIVVFLALLLINALTPWLQKLGFGRLPGDIRFKIFGREIFIPLASTIILSLVCAGISKVLCTSLLCQACGHTASMRTPSIEASDRRVNLK